MVLESTEYQAHESLNLSNPKTYFLYGIVWCMVVLQSGIALIEAWFHFSVFRSPRRHRYRLILEWETPHWTLEDWTNGTELSSSSRSLLQRRCVVAS